MRLVLIGPPGCGKGTQAQLLIQRLGLVQIATGDILREAVAQGTPAGKKAKPYMDSGKLAPDDLVNEVIADVFRRSDRPEDFVLDGYPRTLAQATALDTVLQKQSLNLNAVVFLEVADEELIPRIAGRRICPKDQTPYHVLSKPPKTPGKCDLCGTDLVQRADDREETVRERLKVYRAQTAEVIPYYRNKGLLREVPGRGDIETISAAIEKAIGK